MKRRFSRFLLPASIVCVMSGLNATIAVAGDLPQLPGQGAPAAAAPAAVAAAPAAAAEPFVSTGAAMRVDALGITITPPAGWQVESNTGSLSLVMREPRNPAPSYDKPKYQRNITVAAIHRASPIDEQRAAELKAELTRQFGADSLVSNFQIVEHKFFNYRGVNDGLLVYSSLTIGEYAMMQMHVLVSGQEKQFLLTYTDLADQFTSAKDAGFEKAWNSMVSLEVTGDTPARTNELLRYGAILGSFGLLLLVAVLLTRRAKQVDYAGEADELIETDSQDLGSQSGPSGSMLATLAGGWRLDGKDTDDVDGIEFTSHAVSLHSASGAGSTRQTEYVSSY